MYTGFQHLHSGLAWVFLLLLAIVVVYFLVATIRKKEWSNRSKRLALSGLIITHIQLVVGLVLYFLSPLGWNNFGAGAMGESLQRLYILEHPLINIVGIVLITVGYSLSKRAKTDQGRNKRVLIFYGIGLLLVLSRIPWQVWP
ncbi:MAG: hypothetical protein EA409_00920 [Saprospirales bacterium]|nr:MAG: hypothetical protein EA409_00920 [Saprospirales bacterium]